MHYATRLKKRIDFLEAMITKYYLANYNAKESVGINPGVMGVTEMCGHEECITLSDAESMKEIIDSLPLWDCGVR